jgi:hypothetical protein
VKKIVGSLFAIIVVCVCYLIVRAIIMSPVQASGYEVEVKTYEKGESFTVTPLSKISEESHFSIILKSDSVFVVSGPEELVAKPAEKGFIVEGSVPTGKYMVSEGDHVDANFNNKDTPLKVVSVRNLSYFSNSIAITIWVAFLVLVIGIMFICLF